MLLKTRSETMANASELVALFTSKSIKELEGLTFELNGLQEFLKSETERVQREIDNALSGLKIIIDTISPWRNAR